MQDREGYRPSAKIPRPKIPCLADAGWCMEAPNDAQSDAPWVTIHVVDRGERNSFPGRRGRTPAPAPALVASSDSASAVAGGRAAGDERSGDADWSRLMRRAQDGDREAYRTLLEGMTPYLRSLAGRRFKEASDIEDAVQDILLTVHAVRHAYDPRRPFGPWLVAIANRRIIDRLRRATRTTFREVELTAEHETFSAPPANLGSSFGEASVNEAALHEAIEHLAPEQRQAIRLLKLKEMSLKEAAAASGRSVSALKVATHRAIKSLRKMLQHRSETP
jgi:RNA polymerase sigma-70 factor (ECF subfamily)